MYQLNLYDGDVDHLAAVSPDRALLIEYAKRIIRDPYEVIRDTPEYWTAKTLERRYWYYQITELFEIAFVATEADLPSPTPPAADGRGAP